MPGAPSIGYRSLAVGVIAVGAMAIGQLVVGVREFDGLKSARAQTMHH